MCTLGRGYTTEPAFRVPKTPKPVVLLVIMATRKAGKPRVGKKALDAVRAVEPKKKVGRPRAKHSDPNYTQMSIYVHNDVRTKVKMRLLESGGEFSGLVESLLRDWLKLK